MNAAPGVSRRSYAVGFGLAVVSAVMYSAANIALRKLADDKSFDWAIFVTACKGIGAAATAWVLIGIARFRGRNEFPPRRWWPTLLLAAVCTHVVGNLLFQYSLAKGGLAITVPIVFAMIILTGATLGWFVLREPLTRLLVIAMTLLIAAIAVLSFGADAAADAASTGTASPKQTVLVVVLAVTAGIGYGCVGVVIRRTRLGGVSAAGTLVLISSSGVVGLGLVALARLGPERILATPPRDLAWIATASVCNAVAFFAIAFAYERLPVVRVNIINCSQSAMCATAGVMLFPEPPTKWLITGTFLTIFGLILVGYAKEHAGSPTDAGPEKAA